MSAYPFQRVLRNGAALLLVSLGDALRRWGRRAMYPPDRPVSEEQAAITKAGDALAEASDRLVRHIATGQVGKREGKAHRELALHFLDLRAFAVGDTVWLNHREAERDRRLRGHADIAKLVSLVGPAEAGLDDPEAAP